MCPIKTQETLHKDTKDVPLAKELYPKLNRKLPSQLVSALELKFSCGVDLVELGVCLLSIAVASAASPDGSSFLLTTCKAANGQVRTL